MRRRAAGVQDRLDDGAERAHLLGELVGHVGGVGALDDVDAQRAPCRLGPAELGAVQGPQRHAAVAVRQHGGLAVDHGDDADAGEPPFVARHQDDQAVLRLGRAEGLVHGSVGFCRGEVE